MDACNAFCPKAPLCDCEVFRYESNGMLTAVRGEIQAEHSLDVFLDDCHLMRIGCSADCLAELAIGRLFSEGIIEGMGEVASVSLLDGGACVTIRLKDDCAHGFDCVERTAISRVLSEPFAGGQWGEASLDAVVPIEWNPSWIFDLASKFAEDAPMHRATRGAHSCYLACGGEVLYCCEDIGRHNALDKVIGCALRDEVDLARCLVYSSGRVPTEMMLKAIRARIPIFISKTVPTDRAVDLALKYGVTLLCSASENSFDVFSDPCGTVP